MKIKIKIKIDILYHLIITTSNYYIVVGIMYFIAFIITILSALFSEICFICIDLFIFLLLIDFMCAAIAFAMIIIGIRRNTFNSQGKPVFEDNILSRIPKIVLGLKKHTFRYKNDSNIEFSDKYYSSKSYLILASITGFIPLGIGLYTFVMMGNFILLLWGIIVETFVLFPDILDNVLPFNLKTLKGYALLYIMPIVSIIVTFTI
ncbi:hypothetical protein MSCUN_13110 [Methanosphaera cuniculi]|uniref:Uncharacterized protein n=3 Tax=Methanosphaera cuniculi TaxID=1077256 RepID=A0A2V2BNX8_9EURY|nr:hypothetical protein MSCUN_13110 [Methanosphaera cuniculi]